MLLLQIQTSFSSCSRTATGHLLTTLQCPCATVPKCIDLVVGCLQRSPAVRQHFHTVNDLVKGHNGARKGKKNFAIMSSFCVSYNSVIQILWILIIALIIHHFIWSKPCHCHFLLFIEQNTFPASLSPSNYLVFFLFFVLRKAAIHSEFEQTSGCFLNFSHPRGIFDGSFCAH